MPVTTRSTPLKINMEPENEGLEDPLLFKQVIFRFHVKFPKLYDIWLENLYKPSFATVVGAALQQWTSRIIGRKALKMPLEFGV